jgi:hypothetical protein
MKLFINFGKIIVKVRISGRIGGWGLVWDEDG